jgi:hypothetical protein
MGLGATSRKYTRFGVGMHDFNNDGVLDLFEATGKVFRVPPVHGEDPYAEPNILMRGTKDMRFEEVSPSGGTATPLVATSRAAAFGDFDNDGGIDILVVNRDAAPHLLHNTCDNRGHWLQCRILDEHGRDAIGAVVTASIAGKHVRRDVRTAYSYCAANDPRVHFGLGQDIQVESIEVMWPDGRRERFGPFKADQIITLRHATSSTLAQPDDAPSSPQPPPPGV